VYIVGDALTNRKADVGFLAPSAQTVPCPPLQLAATDYLASYFVADSLVQVTVSSCGTFGISDLIAALDWTLQAAGPDSTIALALTVAPDFPGMIVFKGRMQELVAVAGRVLTLEGMWTGAVTRGVFIIPGPSRPTTTPPPALCPSSPPSGPIRISPVNSPPCAVPERQTCGPWKLIGIISVVVTFCVMALLSALLVAHRQEIKVVHSVADARTVGDHAFSVQVSRSGMSSAPHSAPSTRAAIRTFPSPIASSLSSAAQSYEVDCLMPVRNSSCVIDQTRCSPFSRYSDTDFAHSKQQHRRGGHLQAKLPGARSLDVPTSTIQPLQPLHKSMSSGTAERGVHVQNTPPPERLERIPSSTPHLQPDASVYPSLGPSGNTPMSFRLRANRRSHATESDSSTDVVSEFLPFTFPDGQA